MANNMNTKKEKKPSSLWRDALKRFLRNKTAVTAFCVLLVLALLAIFAPIVAPYDPYATDMLKVKAKPSADSGDTDRVSGHQVRISRSNIDAVLNQIEGAGNGFHNIGMVGASIADDCGAILQNGEVRLALGLNGVAFHDQIAGRFAGTHVEVVSIGSHNDSAFGISDGCVRHSSRLPSR